MATPVELKMAISSATGLSAVTIEDIDRKLVKAELRTKGGRGPNAARMTPLDAARLLTAVLASPQANTSAEAVERYSRTRPDKSRSSDELFAAAKLDDLSALPARHGFVEGLAALIASASTGSLTALIADADEPPHIEVFAFTRATRGRIRISSLPNGLTASIEYAPAPAETKPARGRKSISPLGGPGDLEQSRRITERTILRIAKLLAEEKTHERS